MAFIPSSGSVVAFQSNPANLQASVTGTVAIAGSILTVGSGSVVAFINNTPAVSVQGTVFVSGSVVTVGSAAPANQSVSGSVGIVGTPAVSVQGTVFISGSVVTVGTAAANQSVSGTVQTQIQGSVATVIIGGSIAASFTPPANQSVSGAVSVSNFPTTQNVSGSVVAFQGTNPFIVTGSVQGTFNAGNSSVQVLNFPANQSVSGSVNVSNTVTVVSSISGGIFPISGSVAATITGTPNVNVAGSVVAFQGTNPWIQTFSNSSIIAINAGSVVTLSQGSVITVLQSSVATVQIGQANTVITSIAGAYASNSASIISGLGVLGLGIRNDALSSVLATADGRYSPFTIGPWGEQVISNAPGNKWVSGVGSLFTGVPQPILTSVLGSFINVTGVQIANASANNVYISFSGAGLGSVAGSIIGYTVAPANGGSNIYFANALKTGINSPFQASVSGVSSIFVSAQGFLSST